MDVPYNKGWIEIVVTIYIIQMTCSFYINLPDYNASSTKSIQIVFMTSWFWGFACLAS